jgi:hypothetical protein
VFVSRKALPIIHLKSVADIKPQVATHNPVPSKTRANLNMKMRLGGSRHEQATFVTLGLCLPDNFTWLPDAYYVPPLSTSTYMK